MNLAHLILLITFMLPKINSNELNEQVVFPQDPIDQQTQTEAPDERVELFKVCEDGLGCIETDQTWYHKDYRPVNLKPLPRHIVKTDFVLIKKPNQQDEQLLYASFQPKQDSIRRAGFCNESELMIMIHDFTANGYTGWIKHLSLAILENAIDYNLVSVDWQRGAEPPFDQAIANARLVALEINILLKELKEKMNYSLDNVHIVGHGVGAHIAGYVGATHSKIKKITGLDPTGPRFQGMPYNVKLNPRSAKYVQVIHTDFYHTKSQGINESLGHSDFFVNGNEEQPGCSENSTVCELTSLERGSLNEGEILPGCSHKRAFKYFIESVSSKNCTFQGIRCNSLDDFQTGKCASCDVQGQDCRIFGLKNYLETSENNKFFLNTANHPPFCMLEYRITIHIKDDEKYGYFNFILIDESADISKAYPARNEKNTKPLVGESNAAITGNTFLYFATQPKLGKLKEIKAKWNDKGTVYKLFCKESIKVQKITVLFLGTGEDDGSDETHFCPLTTYAEIENGSYVTFKKCSEKSTSTTESSEKIVATRSDHYRKEHFSSTETKEVTKRIIHNHELRTEKNKADIKRFGIGSTNKSDIASTSIRQNKYKKTSLSGKTSPSSTVVHVRTTGKSKYRKKFYSKNLKKKEDNWENNINNEDKITNETSEDTDYQQLLSSSSTPYESTTTILSHTKESAKDSEDDQHKIQNKQQVDIIQDEENLIKASPLYSEYATKPAKKLVTSKILHPNKIKFTNQHSRKIIDEMYNSTTEFAKFINSKKLSNNHKTSEANSSKWKKSKTTVEHEPVEDLTKNVNAPGEIDENNETESKTHHIKETNYLIEDKNIAPVEDSTTIELQSEETNNIGKEKSIVPDKDSTKKLHSENTNNDNKERNIVSIDDYYTKDRDFATEKNPNSRQSFKSHYNVHMKNEELKAFKDSLNTVPNEESTNENLDELLETVDDDDGSKATETETTSFYIDETSDATKIQSHTEKSDQLSAKWKVYLDKMSKDIKDSNKISSTSKICVSTKHHYTTNEYLSTANLYALLPRIQTESELITQDDIDGKWQVNSEKMKKVFNETYVDKDKQNSLTTRAQVPSNSPSSLDRNRYELENNITSESLHQNTYDYLGKTTKIKSKFTTRNVQDNIDFTGSSQNILISTEDENFLKESETSASFIEDEDLEVTTESYFSNTYPNKIKEDVASFTKGTNNESPDLESNYIIGVEDIELYKKSSTIKKHNKVTDYSTNAPDAEKYDIKNPIKKHIKSTKIKTTKRNSKPTAITPTSNTLKVYFIPGFMEEDKNKHKIIHEYITKNNFKDSDVPTSGSSLEPFNPIEDQVDYIIDSVTKDIDRDSIATVSENEYVDDFKNDVKKYIDKNKYYNKKVTKNKNRNHYIKKLRPSAREECGDISKKKNFRGTFLPNDDIAKEIKINTGIKQTCTDNNEVNEQEKEANKDESGENDKAQETKTELNNEIQQTGEVELTTVQKIDVVPVNIKLYSKKPPLKKLNPALEKRIIIDHKNNEIIPLKDLYEGQARTIKMHPKIYTSIAENEDYSSTDVQKLIPILVVDEENVLESPHNEITPRTLSEEKEMPWEMSTNDVKIRPHIKTYSTKKPRYTTNCQEDNSLSTSRKIKVLQAKTMYHPKSVAYYPNGIEDKVNSLIKNITKILNSATDNPFNNVNLLKYYSFESTTESLFISDDMKRQIKNYLIKRKYPGTLKYMNKERIKEDIRRQIKEYMTKSKLKMKRKKV